VLLLHLFSTELEVTLPSLPHTNLLTSQQRNSLDAGLESTKSWICVFLAIAPEAYIGFPFSVFSQLVRCLTTLFHIRTLDDPTWNRSEVWKTVDVLLILDTVIGNMEQVPIRAGLDNGGSQEGDFFTQVAHLLRSLRPTWEAKLRPGDLAFATIPSLQDANGIDLPDSLAMEYFDNDWLTELFLPSND
jgi:hypothetical protein